MKRSLAIASAIVMAGTLVGCGGGTDAYCDSLKEAKADFSTLNDTDFAKMDEALDRIGEIAGESPDAVQNDWEKLDTSITDMRKALDDAGVTFEDLQAIQENPSELPEGLDQEKLMALGTKLQEFAGEDVQKASKNIEKHAKDECKVDLSS
ncbi:MAG: hypothetical protein GEU96_04820 [Propionibacteriales bacterium]|nr:hypothetical protein [Propionibacteriales bacterium]